MPHRHILIVDDGCNQRLNLQNRLSKLGYQVISLIDSSEKSFAKAASSNPDLVLLDFLHDVEIGDSSAEERVKKVLDIPVIFVAAKEDKTPKPPAKKLPAAGFIVKPFDDLELQAAIERALDSNRHRAKTGTAKETSSSAQNVFPRQKQLTADKDITASPRKNEADALAIVKQIPTFAKLSKSALRELVRRSQFADVATGEYIAFEGDQDEASFIVVSGRLAMTKTAESGKELVVELLGPGDFFGLLFAIEGLPAQLSARAQIDSEILWIQTPTLLAVLKKHPELYKGFAEHLSHCLHASHTLCHGLAHDSVRVRIASLLLSLVAKFSRVKKEFSSPHIIDITRQQIADLTGTTAETATRVTRAMHNDGVIDCGSPGVIRITNLNALKKLAQEEQSPSPGDVNACY